MALKVFSYRRDDSAGHAGRVYDRLEREFGRDLLVMDVDSIPLGTNFVKVLGEEVVKCDVLLAVIGPGWLDARDEDGNRRLENPDDFVRIEIGTALKRDIPVIPILLEGTRAPKADQLPDDLKELSVRNALNIRHVAFVDDMERLIRGLKRAQSPQQPGSAAPSLVDKSPHQEDAQRKAAEEAEEERKRAEVDERKRRAEEDARRKAAEEAEARRSRLEQESHDPRRHVACAVLGIFIAGAVIVTAVVFLVPNGPPTTHDATKVEDVRRKAEEDARLDAARRDPALSVQPGSGQSFRDRLANGQPCATCPEMVVVPSGKFTMGSPASEPQRSSDEVQVSVSIANPFAVGKYAVTRGEFAAFVKETGHKTDGVCATLRGAGWSQEADKSWRAPGFAQDDRHPAVCISSDDAKIYVAWLSSKTGKTYRLLSEAEREYVTRAGTTTPFWWGTSITPMQANYNGNFLYSGGGSKGEFRRRTMPVDSFEANPWGLYNVHGNIWEWTEDCWNVSNSGNPGNGSARATGDCIPVSFVAALGSTIQRTSAPPSASGSSSTTSTATWASGSAGRLPLKSLLLLPLGSRAKPWSIFLRG